MGRASPICASIHQRCVLQKRINENVVTD
jgi:hypothetical protein